MPILSGASYHFHVTFRATTQPNITIVSLDAVDDNSSSRPTNQSDYSGTVLTSLTSSDGWNCGIR